MHADGSLFAGRARLAAGEEQRAGGGAQRAVGHFGRDAPFAQQPGHGHGVFECAAGRIQGHRLHIFAARLEFGSKACRGSGLDATLGDKLPARGKHETHRLAEFCFVRRDEAAWIA
jgi:hypothetical protein